MKIYLVGGAVRDKLLGKEPHDKDYVVVGATPEEMLSLGYKQVGNDFPVFLHPETGEEYALARKEVSTGKGYGDFKFDFNPNITLMEDLCRRDFTINALAYDIEEDKIIDYFDGQYHLKEGTIKHISDHFEEDPLRILRACRFAAQLNFAISGETIVKCRQMVRCGMIEHLTAERVWKEIEKALNTTNFHMFLHYLSLCNAIQIILPEVAILSECKENPIYHPEGNTWNHLMLCLQHVKNIETINLPLLNFGVLCHDLGKAKVDESIRPKYPAHENLGLEVIDGLCDRLKVPNEFRDFGKLACKQHMRYYKFLEMKTKSQYDMIKEITKFKSNDNLELLKEVHLADRYGKAKPVDEDAVSYIWKTIIRMGKIFYTMKDVTLEDLAEEYQNTLSRLKGKEFGKVYRDGMISYLKHKLKEDENG